MDPIIPQPETAITPEPHKHFLNKKFAITFIVLLLLGGGVYAGIWWWQSQQIANVIVPTFTPRVSSEIYTNNQFGFSIALPDSWKGYTVLNSQWEGRDGTTRNVAATGPIITIRHPLWTTSAPREDMPVMIFTPAQWALIQSEKMSAGAAPIPPSILGQNSKYVIALPARYNYDYATGWEEVDRLVHTLKAFEPSASSK
ncbi:MAG: hypothetical protein AAB374_03045 [Patescibacteria group bacterium]